MKSVNRRGDPVVIKTLLLEGIAKRGGSLGAKPSESEK